MSRTYICSTAIVSAVATAALILILLPIQEKAIAAVAVPPLTPTNFNAATSNMCGGRISLTWSAVTDATSYKIFEGTILIAVVPAPATSYQVTGLTPGSVHAYTLRASNSAGDSAHVTAGGASNVVFTRDIVRGRILPEVYDLQVFLNSQGFIVSQTGFGSPGQETTLFGPNTERAMIEFQRSQGLAVTGTLNFETRTRINSIRASGSSGVTASAACTTTLVPPANFDANTSPNCGGKIVFTWDEVPGATAYKIYEITEESRVAPSCLNVPGSGLVGYWTFDNMPGSSVIDESGNGNTGTRRNGPVPVPGKIGTALDFDGVNDFVEIPSSASINSMRNGMTVSAWVKKKASVTGWGSFIARQWGSGVLDLWNLFYDKSEADNYCFSVFTTNNPDIPNECDDILAGSSNGDVGKWVYITGVYDGSVMRLYKNATSIATFAATGQIVTNNAPVTIGAQYNGGSSPSENVSAVLDELCIYNRALSPTEIRTLYDRSSGVPGMNVIETLVATVIAPASEFELMGLIPGSTHTYVIRTVIGSQGSSASSRVTTTASTACPAVPPTPTNFDAATSATCGGHITLAWSSSAGAMSYKIFEGSTHVATVNAPATSYEVTGLAPGSTHTYTIRASNVAGDSSATAPRTAISSDACLLPPDTPGAPTVNGPAFPPVACGGKIRIDWTAVPRATSYRLYRDGGATPIFQGNAATFEDTGLVPGSSHSYRLIASNSAGSSALSPAGTGAASAACITTPPTPTTFTATTSGTCGGRIFFSWSSVSTATSYKIFEGTTLVATVSAPATTHELTGLATGSSHTYTIKASNSAGDSVGSAPKSAISSDACLLPPDTPGAPTVNGPAFPPVACGGKIRIDWTAVPRATSYRLYRDGGATPIFQGNAATFEDTGLVPGSSHSYRLIASNSAGSSALSPAGTGAASAACPVNLTVTLTPSIVSGPDPLTGVRLTATVSGNISGDITYEFDCRNNGTIEFRYVSPNTTLTTQSFDSCVYTPVGTFTAFVRVTVGTESASDTVQITVNPPGLRKPDVPRVNISPFIPLCGGNVVLSWDSVPGATGYHVYRAALATGPFARVTSSPVLSLYTDAGLTPGTVYFYRITAVDSVTESPQSDVSTGSASASCGLSNLECRPVPETVQVGQLTLWKATQNAIDLSPAYTCVWSGSALGSGTCPFSRIVSFSATGTKSAHLNVFSGGASGTQVGSLDCTPLLVVPTGTVIEI